eukprot:767876-Hanusia_phi.AAC.4
MLKSFCQACEMESVRLLRSIKRHLPANQLPSNQLLSSNSWTALRRYERHTQVTCRAHLQEGVCQCVAKHCDR